MRLFIAEKPSMARSIADALDGSVSNQREYLQVGDDIVTWCVGHLMEQAKPEEYDDRYKLWRLDDLPILPERWKSNPRPDVKDRVQVIGNLVKRATLVVHAGDPDREGQLIVDEVLDYVGNRLPVQRIWLQELNVPGIRKALAKMKPNSTYKGLLDEAIARSRADWLVGMNMTRAYSLLWRKAGGDGPMHVGRVQTAALGLVVRRDREIEAFVPKDYYNALVRFRHDQGEFVATWRPPIDSPALDNFGRITDQSAAAAVVEKTVGKDGRIGLLKTDRKRMSPPLPYTLADLQKDANKRLALSPQQTLDIAQALYETHKVTSYPRSDCPYLPEAEFGNARAVMTAVFENFGKDNWAAKFQGRADLSRRSGAWDDKKLGAHHGLIPTVQRKALAQMSSIEAAVYELIVRRYLAQFYPTYEYDATTVHVEVEGERFQANGTAVVEQGWRRLYPSAAKKDGPKDKEAVLPSGMKQGDATKVVDGAVSAGKTEPPPRYDGASLVDAMEKAHLHVDDPSVKAKLKEVQGIGTSATRAGIIQALVDRGYLGERKKKVGKSTEFVSSDRGRALIDLVDPKLSKVDMTARFEGRLTDIHDQKTALAQFEAEIRAYVTELIAAAIKAPVKVVSQGVAKSCPKCGTAMSLRDGSRGPFWGCRGYPDCRHTEPASEEDAKSLNQKSPAPKKTRKTASKSGQSAAEFPL